MVILVVDDESSVRQSLERLFKKKHDVLTAEDGAQAFQILEKTSVDVVITDHQMPNLTGLDLVRKGRPLSPQTSFILMTAYGSVEQAVEAIKLGAEDYFLKPFDLDEIEHRIRRVEDLKAWKAEASLKSEEGRTHQLIGKSSFVHQARSFIEKAAQVPSPVLLLGASGTGKEVVARAIHDGGPRKSMPFVAINCASLTETLTESELFGHEKGAFTGANAAKPGKFELAKGGTLFLDEIGEMSPGLQAKLLRVLQEKEFFRVGGVRQIKTDARVIAATHRPIKEMVRQGQFREDLFFRMNILTMEFAPLSRRREDIPALVEYFCKKIGRELGRNLVVSPELISVLQAYDFPGNIRELQNVLERLAVLAEPNGVVDVEALPSEFRRTVVQVDTSIAGFLDGQDFKGKNINAILEAVELRLILDAMKQTANNQQKAADLLGITRGGIQYKLRKFGLLPPVGEPAAERAA